MTSFGPPVRVALGIIIPALNEEASIGHVVSGLRQVAEKQSTFFIQDIVVVDNGSADETMSVAATAGAHVLSESRKGYGYACKAGIAWFGIQLNPPVVIVFADGDLADDPQDLPKLIEAIARGADLVIGSRYFAESGSLTFPQRFGNALAVFLIRLLYGQRFTDLGPFRAIRWEALLLLDMQDNTYGWTVEMQLKAARRKLRCDEIRVNYRRRVGVSKVSGTIKGSILAGDKILTTIFKYRL